jgi:hypothetical protein
MASFLGQYSLSDVELGLATSKIGSAVPTRVLLQLLAHLWFCSSTIKRQGTTSMTSQPKYLTGDPAAINDFIDRFDVGSGVTIPRDIESIY